MKRYLVAVREDAPSYWSAMFSDGSFEQLDAVYYSDAQAEADRKFGVAELQQIEMEEDFG